MTEKTKKFIERVKKVHGEKYDYSKTEYTRAKDKITVTCHEKDEFGYEHGDFRLRACNHLGGVGCPKCGGRFIYTKEEWCRKANKVHNNKYDYSLITDTRGQTTGEIICPIHGVFPQELSSHLMGCGCPKCNGGVADTKDGFVKSANEVHGSYYTYDNFVYVNRKTTGLITCPRHGDFEQTPDAHLRGSGCKKCKSSILENIVLKRLNDNNIPYIFQSDFTGTHKYKADFEIRDAKLIIECQGEQHFYPTKFSSKTSDEKAKSLLSERIAQDKSKYETATSMGYDVLYFYIPKYFHNNTYHKSVPFYKGKNVFTDVNELISHVKVLMPKDSNHDLFYDFLQDFTNNVSNDLTVVGDSMLKCKNFIISFVKLKPNKRDSLNSITRMYKKRNYTTIHIFEDEYLNHRQIVIDKLRHIIGIDNIGKKRKIYARKCTIREISKHVAEDFINLNHIQGFVASTVYLGAFLGGELIGVMTFLRETPHRWMLSRFCTDNNSVSCGVGGKLFKYFIDTYEPTIVKTFADKRWTQKDDNLYTKLGFHVDGNVSPDYHYFRPSCNERLHKFGFRKQILHKKYGLPLTMTELEMTQKLGYERIWDCGLIRYVYENTAISQCDNPSQDEIE